MLNLIIFGLLNGIASLVIFFFSFIIFFPINRLKKIKSKEEQLFLQKAFLSLIFSISFLIYIILYIFGVNSLYEKELLFFNIYIIALVLYNFFLSYELYFTFINPVHYFNRIFRQKKYNYIQEFIIFLICIITLAIDYLLKGKKEENEIENEYFIIFIIIGKWKCFLILLLCILSLVFCYKIKSKISKFCFKKQEKLYDLISKRTLSIYLYSVYGLFYAFPVFCNIKVDNNNFYNHFGNIFFITIIFIDYLIHISIISTTKFCEYKLRQTILQYYCSFFYTPRKYNKDSGPLVNESSINEGTGLTTIQNETFSALEISAKNPKDKELIAIFKNGIFIEDYFFHYFDQILNIITSSINQIYFSKYFSAEANEQRLCSTYKIGADDMSTIGGTMQNLTASNVGNKNQIVKTSSTNQIGDETIEFDFKKENGIDNLEVFKDVLEEGINIADNNNNLNIKIKSFFTPKCIESIYGQRLKGRNIGNSLLSHFIIGNNTKNRNKDNPNAFYWSLLGSNGKEEYFNKLKNTSIKTYDKNFTLDIFDTNNEDIDFRGKNKDLANLLDKYFTYIIAKGINGTFIPSLVGVFKVKINEFRTLLVFITRNSLVENVPKNFFTYWQLIRFFDNKPQKIASSQFNSGSLIKDDPIFERSFQIETKKENPNYNKVLFRNYLSFEDIIKNDLEFLKNCGAKNFYLLLMYYEYENTQKNDENQRQTAIKIKKTDLGTEIVEENLPKGGLFEEDEILQNNGKMSDSQESNFLKMGDLMDDNNFGAKNMNIKKSGNLIDIDEKVDITGYEGILDSFNCICFFTFENIFDIRKRLFLEKNYYSNFEKKILNNFNQCNKTI